MTLYHYYNMCTSGSQHLYAYFTYQVETSSQYRVSRHHPATIPPPSRHHPATIPPPSRHHPATIPPPSRHHPATIPPPSRHHPATIPPPSRHHPATMPPPSRHHPSTIPQPSPHHAATNREVRWSFLTVRHAQCGTRCTTASFAYSTELHIHVCPLVLNTNNNFLLRKVVI